VTLAAAEIALVTADLRERLLPAFLRRIRSIPEAGLLLELRANRADCLLLVSLEPTACRLHLVEPEEVEARTPEGFARTVHQALSGERLVELEQLGGDRALRFAFGARSLVLELTGRHANAFLLDAEGIIRSSFRTSQSRKRSLLWGQPYQAPLPRADGPWRTVPSRFAAGPGLHAAIAAAYVTHAGQAVETVRRRGAVARLRLSARRLERLVENLRRELDEAATAELWRRRGELLKAVPAEPPRGARSVTVTDWFDPATPEIAVPLDPALSLRANRDLCFRKARKLARRPEAVRPRLAVGEAELRTTLADLDVLETAPWDDPVAAEVVARWTPPAPAVPPRRSRGPAEHVPYRTFRASDGLEILVGKSARDNDRLTFQLARGWDAWLHAAGAAGSHVIVRLPKGRAIPSAAVRDAAALALHYSKLGKGGEGEVYIARRCDVRRVRGGAPGQVTVTHERRVWVRLEPERLRALLDTAADG
jgi:predicted ribosome quality control (RQC) complex YloA/Tae2 family protein